MALMMNFGVPRGVKSDPTAMFKSPLSSCTYSLLDALDSCCGYRHPVPVHDCTMHFAVLFVQQLRFVPVVESSFLVIKKLTGAYSPATLPETQSGRFVRRMEGKRQPNVKSNKDRQVMQSHIYVKANIGKRH